MKTVLFLAYYYPPSVEAGSKRAEGFARYLPEHGFQPLVLTVSDGNYATAGEDVSVDPPWVVRVAERTWLPRRARSGARGRRATTTRDALPMRLLKRVFREVAYVPDAYRGFHTPACDTALRLLKEQRVDVLLTTSSPFTLLRTGHALSSRTGIPWVADLRDLWVRNHFGYPYSPLRRALDMRMEQLWLNGASRITTATRGLARVLADSGYGHIPVECVYNGFFEPARTGAPRATAAERYDLTICYTGTLHDRGRHDATALFAALRRLRALRPSAAIRADFFGAVNGRFQSQVDRFGLQDVVAFRGQITREEAQVRQGEADVLLLLLPDTEEQHVTVPSKVFDYLAARRAILALVPEEGEVARILRRVGVDRILAPRDEEGIAGVLTDMVDVRRRLGHVPPQGDRQRIGEYSYRNVTGRLAEVLRSAMVARTGTSRLAEGPATGHGR